jgi:hypothetical protein
MAVKELQDRLRPRSGVVTTGSTWDPQTSLLAGTGQAVIGAQSVESASGNLELIRSLRRGELLFSEAFQDVTDEGRSVAVEQLLILFRSVASRCPEQLANQFVAQRSGPSPWRVEPKTT